TGEYKLRTYLFFGDQEIGAWYISPDPIIKFVNSTSRGLLDTVPESLREIRKLTGFEFGRFDYTVVDEEIVLFDMNKTPAVGPATLQLMSEQIKLGFANAVYDF
ncbi:MAG: hypothetical protein U9N50_10795, partial [Pseudomonadota bacterium]|nr:hypothetical protein [Pseudomonadota bacterium]